MMDHQKLVTLIEEGGLLGVLGFIAGYLLRHFITEKKEDKTYFRKILSDDNKQLITVVEKSLEENRMTREKMKRIIEQNEKLIKEIGELKMIISKSIN